MKPHFLRLLAFVLLSVMLATTAFADMGPKPSVTITVEGEQRVFYATLLSKASSVGPSSYAEPGSEADLRRRERYTEQTLLQAYEAMQAYQDPDGFYFLGEVFSCPDGVFQCCYYPPDEFKMLLWFPDDGSLICSDSESRFAFESVYRGELADGRLTLHRELDIPGKALSFLARVAATLLLELALALVFGYRKGLVYVLLANLVTQIGLNAALAVYAHAEGTGIFFVWFYLILELIVFAAEAIFYCFTLAKTNEKHPGKGRVVLYALLANALSFFGGIGLNLLWPMTF